MDKRILNLAIGIGLALIAIFLIHGYMQQREQVIQGLLNKGEIIEVVVAIGDIPKESTIDSDMVRSKRVKSSAYQPGDLTSIDSVIGKFTSVDILKGQHISRNMLRSLSGAKFLAQRISKGMRAITIPVDKISAIEGLIKPGDFVDIIGTFRMPSGAGNQVIPVVVNLFQGVKILATGKNISPYRVTSTADTVTVSLKPDDIKILTYTLESDNKIRLVLRAPLDTSQDLGYVAVTFEILMKEIGLWATPPQADNTSKTIEFYRGSEKGQATVPR